MLKNKIISNLLILSVILSLLNISVYASNSLNYSNWAATEVIEAQNKGIIPEEMLEEDLTEDITRAEFAAISVNLLEKVTGREYQIRGGSSFNDVLDSKYYDYIVKAYNASITVGTSDNTFEPNTNITREQLATMLCRTIKSMGDENYTVENDDSYPLDITGVVKFADDNQISSFAKNSVYYMSKHGITKGVDSSHFAPLETATREQAILLALRIYNSIDELPITQKEVEKKELKINYNVIEKCENTTADKLISGLEDDKYTIEQLSDILNIDFQKTSEVIDEIGSVDCQSFEWNGYYITIVSWNESVSSYKEPATQPTYIECDDMVMIDTTAVKNIKFDFKELSLEVGEVYKFLHARITASRLSEVDVEWISSDENIASVEDRGTTGYIHAKKAGIAYITAQVQEGNTFLQAQCKVIVEKEPEKEPEKDSNTNTSDNEFEFAEGTLLGYNGTDTNIIIPDQINGEKVIRIAANAFYGNKSLEYVEISSGIETIYYKAFAECSNLKAVFIPDTVETIYDDSFYNCYKLLDVYYDGSISTDWQNIKIYKMANNKGTPQDSTASFCFPSDFALHNIIYKGNVFADMNESTSDNGNAETEPSRPTRPTVDTGSDDNTEESNSSRPTRPTVDTGSNDDEDEGTSSRPTRPVVDLTTTDDNTTNSKPTRPIVDVSEDNDNTTSQPPSRPTVDTTDEEDSSNNGRPTRPTV